MEISPEDVGQQLRIGAGRPGLLDFLPNGRSALANPLAPGAIVFINMIKQSYKHFDNLVAATSALKAAGYRPVPHLPASRFANRDEFRVTFEALACAGAHDFLVMGGNDFSKRIKADMCTYGEGASSMLTLELGLWQSHKITRVSVCGFPDGHPAFGFDASATAAMLASKVRFLFEAGMDVTVVTQFCFDPRRLLGWLQRTRQELHSIRAEFSDKNELSFRIGLPSPSDRKTLIDIANACQVPAGCCPSAFSMVDGDHDGKISLGDLKSYRAQLGFKRDNEELEAAFKQHADKKGFLNEAGFCELVVDDAIGRQAGKHGSIVPSERARGDCSPRTSIIKWGSPLVQFYPDGTDPSQVKSHQLKYHPLAREAFALPVSEAEPRPHDAMAPSVFVDAAKPVPPSAIEPSRSLEQPRELLLALASFCEAKSVPETEIMIHFFPFGGLPSALELTSALRSGSFPEPCVCSVGARKKQGLLCRLCRALSAKGH